MFTKAPRQHRARPSLAGPDRFLRIVLALAACLTGLITPAEAKELKERAPCPKARGEPYAWQTGSGLRYEYYVPKDYDGDQGANLVLILHGSNLDRRWGFANHSPGTFRPGDILVCPDGTTPNGSGGFNFRQADKDVRLLNEVHAEFRQQFKVLATFLYGHSQGAFFACFYAGAYPALVQGVLAQAGGVWIGTSAGKKGYHQAISVMHGTADPVVPFSMSGASRDFYLKAGFEKVHLRALRDWNHWPDWRQAAVQLAWCEGMTSDSPERVLSAMEELKSVQEVRDPVALYQVATRLSTLRFAELPIRERALRLAAEVEALADCHLQAIDKEAGRSARKPKLEKKPWIGHLRLFLQEFDGMPACDQLRAEWKGALKEHAEKAGKAQTAYLERMQDDVPEAFVAGVDVVARGFLAEGFIGQDFLDRLSAWRKEAQDLKISRTQVQYYDQVIPVFEEAMKMGAAAFDAVK
ncbi:MAG: hypothetical protein V2A76_14425 [Planctomycetota bacterium]